ncbi:phage tail spike protein [Streptococcus pluranimalium]|uniref:phage tail spike protein n=1 Tax=Streptococcus pluranimalium TaxID=82348 RepID=UPI0040470400
MLLRIHNAKLEKVAYIDNDKSDTLHFYKDKWSRYLDTGTSSFEFTVFKRSIKSDTVKEKAYSALTERAFVSFDYRGKTYLFNVMSTDETEHEIACYCENLNLELLNEYSGPYKATKSMSFVDYCNLFDILRFGAITIGKNEVEGQTRTIEWTGQDTDLKRLLSIANNFDAEIEFETHLKDDSSLKSFVMNIYKKHDDKNQGVGRRREDVLLSYGKNISGVRRKIDKTGIYNAIKPTGKRTEKKTQTVKIAAKTPSPAQKSAVATWSGGDLKYGGNTLSKDTINTLLKYCVDYNVLPSGVISQLYVESFWGKSNVARVDRNWGGLTWTGTGSRPSGVTVTRGSARPANEGGYYMRFANLADYFKDYMYLIAKQGLYAVVGKKTIDDYTKGLFRVGGAKYDYAAAGHSHYITLMRDVRSGVNRNNNSAMDKLDKLASEGYSNTTTAPKTAMTVNTLASKTKSVLNELNSLKGRRIGSGQCYAIPAWYAMKIGGPWLGGGVTNGFRGLIKGGMAAGLIGDDYNWKQFGWQVVRPKKVADIIPGAIANIKINHNGGQIVTGPWGHTVVVKAVSGNTVTVLEQNYANRQFLEERNYTASTYLNSISTLCYPPEIASGKRIDGKASQPVASPKPAAPKEETKTETTEQEVVFSIDSKRKQEWKNEEGIVEFYLENGLLYAPLSKNLYPSAFTGIETTDNWIRKDIEVDTDNEDKLISVALADLRRNCYPAITYEVTGYHGDLDIGDTIKITDSEYVEGLILEARVSEQHLSFTNPQNNATIFANFKALENELSDTLEARMEALAEMARPYELRLSTDKGTTFINQLGRSVLMPKLLKANKEYEADYLFKHQDNFLGAGSDLLVEGTDVTDSLIITVEAYIDNELMATQEVTFVNIIDESFGVMGKDGIVHTAYANSPDGTEDFSLIDSNRDYLGIYTDNIPEDSTDPSRYKWTKIKGEKGDKGDPGQRGLDGLQGERGEQGLPGKNGVDGRTQYTHIAYSNSADGSKDFSVSASDRAYIGMYVDFNSADSNNPSDYAWTLVKGANGANGVAGKAGVDGRTPYLHIAYATSNDGSQGFSTTDSVNKTYIGTYTDYTQADSTSYTDYKWTLIKGADGNGIANVTNYYLATTASSGVTKATTGWTTTPQQISVDKRYLWNYRVELYTNGTSKETTPAVIGVHGEKGDRGIQGIQGVQGIQGIPGTKGADGRTQYTHIAYADNATGGGFSQTDQTKSYIGMYVDFSATDSTNPAAYKWSKWKGEDGAQGIPGAKGADGRTPYIHFAYANSADGRTDFSLTQTGNKRYIGTYTDYTATDSQDPTKYRWVDMVGTVEVGGRNLLLNSNFEKISKGNSFTVNNQTYNTTAENWTTYNGGIANAKTSYHAYVAEFEGHKNAIIYNETNGERNWKGIQQTLGDRMPQTTNNFILSADVFVTGAGTRLFGGFRYADESGSYNFHSGHFRFDTATFEVGKWQRVSITVPFDRNKADFSKSIIFYIYAYNFTTNAILAIDDVQLETGNVATNHSLAQEDIQADIDSKADEKLTTDQINMLHALAQQNQAELEARATLDELSRLQVFLNDMQRQDEASREQTKTDLRTLANRVATNVQRLGEMKQVTEFMTTYISQSEEGMVIGKKDSTSLVKVSSDKISFVSGGEEVAYISQGVLHIDNGVFATSVRIGHFITQAHPDNEFINMTYFVP